MLNVIKTGQETFKPLNFMNQDTNQGIYIKIYEWIMAMV